MKKYLALAVMLLVAGALFAQEQAILKDVSGKVEVQLPGRPWAPAARNQAVPQNASISTGFNSHATLELISSTVRVKPLTRMTITELVKKEGKAVTTLDLRVGRLNARVDKAEGLEHDFKLRSPVSTAAVRGTELDFSRGKTIMFAGNSRVTNKLGQGRSLGEGEKTKTSGNDKPKGGEDGYKNETTTVIVTVPVVVAPPPPPPPVTGGSIRVIIGEYYEP